MRMWNAWLLLAALLAVPSISACAAKRKGSRDPSLSAKSKPKKKKPVALAKVKPASPVNEKLDKNDNNKNDNNTGINNTNEENQEDVAPVKGMAKAKKPVAPAQKTGNKSVMADGAVLGSVPTTPAGTKTAAAATPAAPDVPGGPTAQQVAATTVAISPQAAAIESGCRMMITQRVAPYQKLFTLLPKDVPYTPSGSTIDQLLAAKPDDCASPERRRATVKAVADAVIGHSGKIGVILPLSGPRGRLTTYVLNGMRASFKEAGMKFDDVVVLKDSAGVAANAEGKLAELVFKDRVAMVIGGMEKAEADALAKQAAALQLPVVLVNRDRDVIQPAKTAFRVYPDEKRLADTLEKSAKARGFHRFVVLRPSTGKSDKIADYFRKAVAMDNGTVVHDLIYTPGNFESMSAIGRTMFQADMANRKDEYTQAYKKAKQAAAAEGVPFDPRMVVLRPVIDFDAVFLPDDFRTVRHFAKLFKFHMVNKLPMIGNHEWRSPALVAPWDSFLEGSFFADFIGNYTRLPAPVTAPTGNSPYFVQPQNVVQVDFQLIGYRLGRVGTMAIQSSALSRARLAAAMPGWQSDAQAFFGKGAVFDGDRNCNWPTYVFSVAKERIVLDIEDANAAVSAAALDAARITAQRPIDFVPVQLAPQTARWAPKTQPVRQVRATGMMKKTAKKKTAKRAPKPARVRP